ncbi:MAG: hypothetical protein R2838_17990 [Caldilineaceae bacterium]
MNISAGRHPACPGGGHGGAGHGAGNVALGPTGEWYQVTLPDREEPAFVFAGLTTPRARWTLAPTGGR